MRFSLNKMLIAVGVFSLLVSLASLPRLNQQRMVSNGIRYANESWPTHAVIYDWPPRSDSSTGILITSHVDRDSGLTIQTRAESTFREAHNREIDRLLSLNGPPEYSLRDLVPTDTEIHRMFTATTMETVEQFPHQPTASINLQFGGALSIKTTGTEFTKGASMYIGYNMPVYVQKHESLIYVKLGDKWMGVFHSDGRLLFEVH